MPPSSIFDELVAEEQQQQQPASKPSVFDELRFEEEQGKPQSVKPYSVADRVKDIAKNYGVGSGYLAGTVGKGGEMLGRAIEEHGTDIARVAPQTVIADKAAGLAAKMLGKEPEYEQFKEKTADRAQNVAATAGKGVQAAGRKVQEAGDVTSEYWTGKLSEPGRQLSEMPWYKADGIGNKVMSATLQAARSAPETIAIGMAGGPVSTAMKSIGVGSMLTNALARTGVSKKLAPKIASWVEEGLAYGSAEGLMAGLSNAKQVGEEIEKIDHAKLLADSPAYQEYYNQTGDESEAKRLLSDDAEAMALGATAVLSTATGAAAGGGLFDKTLTSKNFLLNRVLGGAKEAHQEFWQSGIGEALPANLAMRKAEPDREAMEGVWEEGAAGAGPGFIMGLFGASGGRHEQEGGQDETGPSVAYLNNQAVMELKKRNLPTRDLLRLKNNPEIGRLGIEPRHIDAILAERAQDLEQARFALGGDEQGPLTRAAKQTVRGQQAEIILGLDKDRRERQLAADATAFDKEYSQYQPEVPEPREAIVEEIRKEAEKEEIISDGEQFRRDLEEIEKLDPKVRKYAEQKAEEIVNADPVYAHMDEARKRGLDLNALQKDYDKDTTTAIARKYPAIFSYNGRVRPDEFAQEKGYESLDHMIQAFMTAPPKSSLIRKIAKEEAENFKHYDNLMERDSAREWTGAGKPLTVDKKDTVSYPAPDADIDAMVEMIRANPETFSDEDLDHWTFTSAQKSRLRAARRGEMIQRTGARPGAAYTMAQPPREGTGATETTTAAETGKEEGGKERDEFIPAATGPVVPQGQSAQDFLIRQQATGTSAAGNLEKQAAIPEKYSGRSDDFKKGYADFLMGRERVEPREYHGSGKGAEWYRGWDAANVETPVMFQKQPAGEMQRGPAIPDFKSSNEINEWLEAQAEAKGMSSVEYTTTDEYKGVHSQLRQKFDELRKQEKETEAADARIVKPVRREDGKYWLKFSKGKGYVAAPGAFGALSGTAQQFDTEQEALEWAEKEGYTIETQPKEAGHGLQQEGQGKAEVVPPGFGQNNKVFTKDAAEKAREILRAKLKTQLSAGLDPEMMQSGITLAGYYIEGGTRKFADYSKAMINDLGEGIRPYLKAFYDAIRSWPGFNTEGMSTPEQVEKLLAQGGEKVVANVGDKVHFTAPGRGIAKEMAGTVEKVHGDHDAYTVRGENGLTYQVYPNDEEGTDTMRPAGSKPDEKKPGQKKLADLDLRKLGEFRQEIDRRLDADEKLKAIALSPQGHYDYEGNRKAFETFRDTIFRDKFKEVATDILASDPAAAGDGIYDYFAEHIENEVYRDKVAKAYIDRLIEREGRPEEKEKEGGRALARFENKEDGIAVSVFPHEKGFSVVTMDTDSGEILNTVKIFPGKTEAINYAQEIAAGKQARQPATPHEQIADKIARRLKNKQRLSWAMLFRMADEAYGGTQAEGKYVAKDAYDAMELGVNKYLLEKGFGSYSYNIYYGGNRGLTHRAVKDLKEMIDLLPTQTRRSAEQDEFQQFSTPPPLAYLANWVANLKGSDVYLEPSAGIGGLAVFGKMAGAEVIVNELSERRRGLLESMGFDRVTKENAEQLHNILPKDIKPTVIVMNPPFSASAGRIEGRRDTRIGAQHIEQALKRLQSGGRLVAIVGEGMAHDRPAFREWWRKIEAEYTVRANVGMSGKEYRKYGTTFDNQLLIIDKTGPTTDNIIKDRVEKVEDLIPLLEEVRNARPENQQAVSRPGGETQPVAPEPTGQKEADTGQGAAGGGDAAFPPAGAMGHPPAAGAGGTQGSDRVPVPQGEPGQGDEAPAGGRPAAPEREPEPGGHSGRDTGAAGQQADGGDRGVQQQTGPEVTPGLSVEAVDQQHAEELTDSVYENYSPERINIPGAKPHPTPLVQSAAMASVKPPKPTYSPSIPQRAIEAGKISDIQIEAVVYAGQAMDQVLPDGETRQGYFIGDGTGVGKGREIAAILWDNWNKGRKKAVWISEKKPLFNDAKRDLRGVGWRDNQLVDHGKVKAADSITAREGILFSTYDTIKAGEKKEGGRTRLDQIVEWLGEDFDGVVVFDESHNMGNSLPVKKKRGRSKPSAKALAGIELQRRLPKARVLYVSATGATEVMNLAYADRLGLWGRGTPFPNKIEFVNQVSAGGMAVMEMIARDMKARGLYTSRSLSYDGVEYDRLEHVLSDNQRTAYDRMAEGWQVVLRNINDALDQTGGAHSAAAKSAAMSAFWGAHQRFFNQYLIALQMPSVIKQMRKDLKAGHAIVVQLTSTYEASQERALSKMGDEGNLEDLDISPFDTLMEFVQNSFPVAQYQEVMDQDGNVAMQIVRDSDGNIVENADAVAMRERLLDELGALRKDVADSPIDQIIDEFGIDTVGEVTGRKRRVVWKETEDKGRQRVVEKRPASSGAADAQAFMDDRKQVLIFSEAGGTGRSYHADRGEKNQRKRIHYLLQPGWRADKAVQGLGRTHRSNQAHPPKYILVTTDLKGQKRFLSTIARRLDQLGALTKGQRQTGSQGIFAARDNLESQYAADALRRFFQDLVSGQIGGLTVQEFEEQTGLKLIDDQGGFNTSNLPTIQQFLNRLLSLKIETMDMVFDEFSSRMDAIIEAHARAGTLDVGMETLRADSVKKVEDEVVHIDERTGAATKYIKLRTVNPAPILTFEAARQNYAKNGFFKNRASGKIWAVTHRDVTNRETGDVVPTAVLRSVTYSEQRVKLSEFTEDKWERIHWAGDEWQAAIDAAPKTVTRDVHLISGALLPVWDRLSGGHARVMRVQTDQGERMIGRVIPESQLQETLQKLGVSRADGATKVKLAPTEIHARVLDQDYTIRLVNDWTIVRRRVSGDDRIEIKGMSLPEFHNYSRDGVFSERIEWNTRFFIPAGKEGVRTIEAITKDIPVLSATPPAGAEYGAADGASLFDRISEEGGTYEIQGTNNAVVRDRSGDSGVQLQLFTNAEEGRRQEKFIESYPARIGTFYSDFETIENAAQAAQLLSPIAARAQEVFAAVVLDKDKKPIAVLQHSIGTTTSNQVAAGQFIGSVHNLTGADSIWIAHNHPSGRVTSSPQDRTLTKRLDNALQGTGVSLNGHVIMTPTGKATLLTDTGDQDFTFNPPTKKSRRVGVTERRLRGNKPELLSEDAVASSALAKEALKDHSRGLNGILFLDSGHRPIRFMPVTLADMQALRKGEKKGLAAKLYRFIDRRNSVSAAIVNMNGGTAGEQVAAGQNLVNFFAQAGVTVLDIIAEGDSLADQGVVSNMRDNAMVSDFMFHSRGPGRKTGTRPAQVLTALRKFIGNAVDGLVESGRLEVVRTAAGLPAHIGRFLKMVAWHGTPHRFQQESRVKDANGKIIAHYAANETIPSDIAQRVRDGEYTVETLRHGRFRSDKIGTGEGVQAYGHGLYFAGRREVAEWYRNRLSERVGYEYKGRMYNDSQYDILEEHLVEDFNLNEDDRKMLFDLLAEGVEEGKKLGQSWLESAKEELFAAKTEFQRQVAESQIAKLKKPVAAINSIKYFKPGAVYKVELAPKEDEYLLWDKPLSEQSEKVRKALREAYEKASGDWKLALAHSWDSEDSGKYLYFGLADEIRGKGKVDIEISPNRFERIEDPEEGASAFLHSIGIRGIKYLDGTSRAKGEGAYNYVIFSDEDVEISAMYSKDGAVVGAYDPTTGKIWLVADQMDPGDAKYVFTHEAGHALLREDRQFMAQREKILSRFEQLKDRSEKVKAAYAKVPEDTPAEDVAEEALMYFVQDKNNHKHSIFRRVVAAVKAALARLGVPVDRLNLGEADFVALFTGGAKRWARTAATATEGVAIATGEPAQVFTSMAKRHDADTESFDDILGDLLGKDQEKVIKETREKIKNEGLTVDLEMKHARTVAAKAEQQPSPGETRTWWDRLTERSKKDMLAFLTLRQIREIFGPKSIHAARFYQATRDMAADANQMMAEADKVYGEFAALPKNIADELADIMTRATVDGVDPSKGYKGRNAQKRTAHKKLKDRFDALAEREPRVRDVWQNVRQTYDTSLQRLRDALLERLMRTAGKHDRRILKEFYRLIFHGKTITPATVEKLLGQLSGEGRAVIRYMDQVRLRFEQYIKEGPYFPLSRFGPYVAVATKKGFDREVRTFETMKQRDQYVAAMKGDGWNIKTTYSKNYSREIQGVSNSFVEGVIHLIDGSGMEQGEKRQILDDLNQLFIQTIPDLSHRKHFAHRQKIEGYSRDQLRAFAETMQHAAHHISRIRHADKLTTALREMDQDINKARTGHHEELRHVWNELSERLEKQILNPNIHPVAHALTSLGFAWNIGPSIASALVNLSQTPLVAYPMMAARFKARRGAAVELTKASSDYFHSPFEIDKGFSMAESTKLTDDERDMIRKLIADGTIDVTQAHSLAQAAAPDYLNLAKTAHGHKMLQVMRLVSYPFHVAEVANRQITALAAYRLARSKGMDHRNAISEARELTLDSHFDYSQANRARFMEGNARRVLFLFKQYSQQMTFLLGRSFQQAVSKGVDKETKRIARAQLAGILGGHFLVSGLMGMPVIGTIADIMAFFINGLGNDDDPFDWEVDLRNLLADTVGKTAGEAIAVGPARMIPLLGQWDVSARMSLGDLWLRRPNRETEGRDKFNQWMNLFAGPVASNLSNMFQGAHAWSEGQHLRGVEMAMPKAIKDGFKTIRYMREGLRSWNDDTLIEEMGYMELFGQLLGFNPSRVSEMYAGKSAIKNRQTRIERRRHRLINAWVRANRAGDMKAAQEAMEKMVMFNRKNPAFTITGGTLTRSYRQRLNVQARTRQGVYLPARKAGLRDEGRFANID